MLRWKLKLDGVPFVPRVVVGLDWKGFVLRLAVSLDWKGFEEGVATALDLKGLGVLNPKLTLFAAAAPP